jgi:glyoxylase-like metal-dependent hydrolase (beta-lactamase superfamily II)
MQMLSHANGITTIDTAYIRHGLAASHLLVEQGRAAFIDVGTSLSADNLLQALDIKGIKRENVDYVIVTHVHLDHAGGAGRLMQELPHAKLVVHPRGAQHMIDPAKLIAGATAVYGEDKMLALHGEILPVPPDRVLEAPDNFSIDLQGRELRCIDTPGHAKHHLCVIDSASHSAFTGDAFGLSYREFDTRQGAFIFPTTTPVQFDPDAMHTSIDKLIADKPKQMYLTHYGEVRNPPKLAKNLHYLVDMFVTLTHDMAGKGKARHSLIVESMAKLLFEELKEHGCALTEAHCRKIIEHDLELNAQGLEIWWDRTHGGG